MKIVSWSRNTCFCSWSRCKHATLQKKTALAAEVRSRTFVWISLAMSAAIVMAVLALDDISPHLWLHLALQTRIATFTITFKNADVVPRKSKMNWFVCPRSNHSQRIEEDCENCSSVAFGIACMTFPSRLQPSKRRLAAHENVFGGFAFTVAVLTRSFYAFRVESDIFILYLGKILW